ncbi:MAG: FeoC-like transcriptional regulator [Propionibacteriaceae bacterium]|jgi:hypothetical protein|nr:FeoC-like transcriptional regulator [Propionibacteriaceae bacterium]
MSGPLASVLEAFELGSRSTAQIARRSGLSLDLVQAAVDHLVWSGRLESTALASGCPASGCGGCALTRACSSRSAAGRQPSRGRLLSLAGRPVDGRTGDGSQDLERPLTMAR